MAVATSLPIDSADAFSLDIPTPTGPTATPPGEDITDPNYIQGKQAYKAKNYNEVLRLMALVIAADPKLAPAHWYRGMADYYQKNYEAGLEEMQTALALQPDYALGYADRGLMYISLGDEARAFADWNKALELNPTLAKVHHNMGLTYFHQDHDMIRAITELKIALSIDPTRSLTWSDLSAALLESGQYQACIDSATRAIDLQTDQWDSYYNRGTCQADLGIYDRGAVDLETFVKAVPDFADGWYNLGLAHSHLNKVQQAIDDYTQAIKLKPTHGWAFINRGGVYNDLHQYDQALQDYAHALAIGQYPIAYVGRGSAYLGLKQYADAAAAYQKAIDLLPGYSDALGGLAEASLNLDRFQAAVDNVNLALQTPSDSNRQVRLLRIRGRAYYGLGQYQQAIGDFDTIISAGFEPIDDYYQGLNYQAAGQKDKAIWYLNHFLAYKSVPDQTKIDDAKARLTQLGQ